MLAPAAEHPVAAHLVAAVDPDGLPHRVHPPRLHHVEARVHLATDRVVEPRRVEPAVAADHHAPRHRRVALGVLLDDLDLLHRRELGSAPGAGHVHAERTRTLQRVDDVVGEPPRRLDRGRAARAATVASSVAAARISVKPSGGPAWGTTGAARSDVTVMGSPRGGLGARDDGRARLRARPR